METLNRAMDRKNKGSKKHLYISGSFVPYYPAVAKFCFFMIGSWCSVFLTLRNFVMDFALGWSEFILMFLILI